MPRLARHTPVLFFFELAFVLLKKAFKNSFFLGKSNFNFKLKLKINSDETFEDFKPHLHLIKILIRTYNFFMRVDPGEI